MLFITNAIKMISNYEQIIKRSSCTASCSRQIKENSRGRKILLEECDAVQRRKYVMVRKLAISSRKRDKLDLYLITGIVKSENITSESDKRE